MTELIPLGPSEFPKKDLYSTQDSLGGREPRQALVPKRVAFPTALVKTGFALVTSSSQEP